MYMCDPDIIVKELGRNYKITIYFLRTETDEKHSLCELALGMQDIGDVDFS